MKRTRTVFLRSFLVVAMAALAAPAGAAGSLLGSAGWKAELDRSQPSPPRLVITAKLHLPTPGYRASLRLVRSYTSNPPIPVYELVLVPPTKPVAQVLVWMDFRHVQSLPGAVYNTVIITHQGKTLARLKVARRKA